MESPSPTRELVSRLAKEAPTKKRHPLVVTCVVSGALLPVLAIAVLVVAGPRSDLGMAVPTGEFWLKIVAVLASLVAAGHCFASSLVPGSRCSSLRLLVGLPVLALGAAGELARLSAGEWLSIFPSYWATCVLVISSIGTVVALVFVPVIVHGAPVCPARAGLYGGIFAGMLAATTYLLACPNDSALFVGAWYPLAIAMPAATGLGMGALVRW